ncbi:MAG: glycosyltransferase family 2 protein [Mediterraneibacter gnavus]
MKMSVLVPTLGAREKEIKRLLETLEKQSYKNFEIIFVTQDNHDIVKNIICKYSNLNIKQIEMNVKGLSRARNKGLERASGEIVVLSDDDCWYPANALEIIVNTFEKRKSAKIVLSQIFDPEKNISYKNYSSNEEYVKNKLQLMSKSSIEVAFKKDLLMNKKFDERLGLGSEFVCGEEVDFLLNNYEEKAIFYVPEITVYHKKKESGSSNKQIIAKGAIYGKNFNIFICLLVLLRDLIIKKENNFKYFFEGYNEYFKRTN